MCRSKHVEPSVNFGIINSITKLHLVGISAESSAMHGSMNIILIVSDCNDQFVCTSTEAVNSLLVQIYFV